MFLNNDDGATLFTIPEELAAQVPCQINPAIYEDPALDLDMDDDDWVRMTHDEQYTALSAKQSAEARAVDACYDCPLMSACAEWGKQMGDRVFGVVGGLTHEERVGTSNTPELIADPTARGPQGQVRDDLIEMWAAAGMSNADIAERLSCSVRTVERRRAGMVTGRTRKFVADRDGLNNPAPEALSALASTAAATTTTAKDAALNALQPARVSPETAAIFDALIDGGLRDRSEIIASVLDHVDRKTALATAPADRDYPDTAAKIAVGARKFLMNRVDIAVRRGRIHVVKTDQGKVLICLDPATAAAWREYRGVDTPAALAG